MTSLLCPECTQGKHRNCTGAALDPATDDFTWCACGCIARNTSGTVSPLLLVAAWVALWVGGCAWAVMGR